SSCRRSSAGAAASPGSKSAARPSAGRRSSGAREPARAPFRAGQASTAWSGDAMDLRIETVVARYHLPPAAAGAAATKNRLDGLLPQAFEATAEDSLADALSRCGFPAEGDLCLREIHVPARLRLSGSDSALALAWSDAFAGALAS